MFFLFITDWFLLKCCNMELHEKPLHQDHIMELDGNPLHLDLLEKIIPFVPPPHLRSLSLASIKMRNLTSKPKEHENQQDHD